MSWEELLALFKSNAKLVEIYGQKETADDIRNLLLDPLILKKLENDDPEFLKSVNKQPEVAIFSQCLAEYDEYSPYFEGCEFLFTREQAIETFKTPEFLNKKKLAKEFEEKFPKPNSNGEGSLHYETNNLSRHIALYKNTDDTPEAKEENRLLFESLYSQEGFQYFEDMILRNMLDTDYSIIAPSNILEGMQKTLDSGFLSYQMFTVVPFLNSSTGKGVVLHPLIQEFAQYNSTLVEMGGCPYSPFIFYNSVVSSCISENFSFEYAVDPIKGKLYEKNKDLVKDTPLVIPDYYQNKKKYEAFQKLKAEKILGPDTKYYKAFDENHKRIRFANAIDALADGKKVTFSMMTEEEKKELDSVLAHPTTVRVKEQPGALSGKGFMADCKALYELMDRHDSKLTWSSDEFAGLKKGLKKMSEGSIPNEEDAREFMRSMLELTEKYLNDKFELLKEKQKSDENAKHSDFTQGRIDAVKEIQNKLRIKLGAISFREYKAKIAARTRHEENQKSMGESFDTSKALTLAATQKSAITAFGKLQQSSDKLSAESDPTFTALAEKIKNFNQKLPDYNTPESLREASRELLSSAEKYYNDNIGKSFDKESFDRFLVVKDVILSSKNIINDRTPVEARQTSSALLKDLATRMVKAQLKALSQGKDVEKAEEARDILESAERTQQLIQKMMNTNAFIAGFGGLKPDALIKKLSEEPRELLLDYAKMNKDPLSALKANKIKSEMNCNSLFTDIKTFGKFIIGPNPLKMSISRSAFGTVSIAMMLQDGYSIDDIVNPSKLTEERLSYGEAAMKKISEGKGAEIMRSIYDALPKFIQYMNEKLTKLPSLLPPDIFAEECRNLSLVTVIAKDLIQEGGRDDLISQLTAEEKAKFAEQKLLVDQLNKPLYQMSHMIKGTYSIFDKEEGLGNFDNFKMYVLPGIASSKLFTMMKNDPKCKNLDFIQCIKKSTAKECEFDYLYKIGTFVADCDSNDYISQNTADKIYHGLKTEDGQMNFAKSVVNGEFGKMINIKLDKDGNYLTEELNNSIVKYCDKYIPAKQENKNQLDL